MELNAEVISGNSEADGAVIYIIIPLVSLLKASRFCKFLPEAFLRVVPYTSVWVFEYITPSPHANLTLASICKICSFLNLSVKLLSDSDLGLEIST
jgi:hypothetical protein